MKAVICDLDGTLALLNGRNPYDASTCEQDLLNKPVSVLVEALQCHGYKIIFVSGRFDTHRKETEQWLKNHNIKYHKLFMRQADDKRRDSIIKRELYEKEIKPNYNVEIVLDDRNQVVAMWRETGLTCLQVAEGNF